MQVAGDDRRICMYPCSSGRMMNVVAFVPRNEVGDIKKGKRELFPNCFVFIVMELTVIYFPQA